MSMKNRRWHQALFPIDETLLDRLLDDHCSAIRGEPFDEGADEAIDESADWLLRAQDDDDDDEAVEITIVVESGTAAGEDVYSQNLRVLDDYLRRRLNDEAPHGAVPTLLH